MPSAKAAATPWRWRTDGDSSAAAAKSSFRDRLPVSLAMPTRTSSWWLDPCSRSGPPGGPPALAHAGQRHQPQQYQRREEQEAGGEAARHLLGIAQGLGQEEATDAAHAADQPGHHADLALETLRDQLEHRAIAHAQAQHADREADHRAPGDGRHGGDAPA